MEHGTCIHYNGGRQLCLRGVSFSVNWPDGPKPCIKWYPKSKRGDTSLHPGEEPERRVPFPGADSAKACPFRQEPDDKTVHASRIDRDKSVAQALAGIAVAAAWRTRPKPAEDRHEIVECPVCKGGLHLSQSSYNGHVHGKCETAGCVSWME